MQKRKGNHNKMPDGSSQEKNTYQRNLVAQIQEGVKDADEGRLITTDELLARVEKWEL
jgi:predicted transcriptional regulator